MGDKKPSAKEGKVQTRYQEKECSYEQEPQSRFPKEVKRAAVQKKNGFIKMLQEYKDWLEKRKQRQGLFLMLWPNRSGGWATQQQAVFMAIGKNNKFWKNDTLLMKTIETKESPPSH